MADLRAVTDRPTLVPVSARALIGLPQSGAAHSLLVGGKERSQHGDADAEDGKVRLENEEEDGGGHGAGDVEGEVDAGDVNEAKDCAYNASIFDNQLAGILLLCQVEGRQLTQDPRRSTT